MKILLFFFLICMYFCNVEIANSSEIYYQPQENNGSLMSDDTFQSLYPNYYNDDQRERFSNKEYYKKSSSQINSETKISSPYGKFTSTGKTSRSSVYQGNSKSWD